MPQSDTERMEHALADATSQQYLLRLYVVGATPQSQRAIKHLTELFEGELRGRYTLEVIDIYQRPELAAGEQIIATPTLIRLLPEPARRLVGDMSDRDRVLIGLDLRPLAGERPEQAAE